MHKLSLGMQIWPAIDIRDGRCVRLQQGDYDRETVFDDNPVNVARQWVQQGAECLHLVDLDGARDGQIVNRRVIAEIVSNVDLPCQLGGGIRDEASIKTLLELGVRRLVLGTKAIEDADWFRQMAESYPDQLVLGIDARDGSVATDGWLKTSGTSATELAKAFEPEPIIGIVYTDIQRDGMLKGPNFDAMAEMKSAVGCPVIASGGVATKDDVRRLADVGMDGCIIGRALYEGRVSLKDALEAAGPKRDEDRR
jgi:phosphoribosylformimino-5-aminoimidazole carboxamide ribotide isomerase